MENPIQPGD